MTTTPSNIWTSAEHALAYLGRADSIPHRTEGEAILLEGLPGKLGRVLDLGSGDGRLLALVKATHPEAEAVALDFSPTMLERLRARFAAGAVTPDATKDAASAADVPATGVAATNVIAHNLEEPLPDLGKFDAVVSSFAIHHLPHPRKRALYSEIFDVLNPGGVFLNLEHVTSPTPSLHLRCLDLMKRRPENEDPANKLLDMETQLAWFRAIGFTDVDCLWKWREFALLAGTRPASLKFIE